MSRSKTLKLKETKEKVVAKFARTSASAGKDTGTPEVQVALLTTHINELTEHLKIHKKDFSSQRGLLKMVGQRRNLLDYLKASAPSRYVKLISDLELRK